MGSRVGAGTYLLSMSAVVNMWCLAVIVLYRHVIVPGIASRTDIEYGLGVLGVVVGGVFFYLSQRRLQDLDCPGWCARILAFPLFAVIFLPVLCFLSAPRFTNRFGKPPPPSSGLKTIAALVSFGVALVLVPYVARLYAGMHLHSAF